MLSLIHISTALAEAGADIAIVDMDLPVAEETAKEIAAATGVKTIAVKTDVTSQSEVDAMIDTVLGSFGRIDIAFCNAGIALNVAAEEMTYEQWLKRCV